jgi:hypothetical protein
LAQGITLAMGWAGCSPGGTDKHRVGAYLESVGLVGCSIPKGL